MGQRMSGAGLRGRGSLVPVLVLALATGCTGGAAPTYLPGGSGPVTPVGSAGGPGGAATPRPTPEPVPLEVAWADIQAQPEDTLVAVAGRVKAGGLVSCFNDLCGLLLKDPSDDESSVIADVPAVEGAGVPNTMAKLPDPYTEADLVLTTADGAPLHSGDMVRVTGTVMHGTSTVWIRVSRIDRAAEPLPTPAPEARTITFKQIAKLERGTLVRIRGTLSVPFFTFCNDEHCSITLEDPASSRDAGLYVTVIRGSIPKRNAMLPLPSDFTNKDLKVYTEAGKRVGYGAKVWITGTLDNEPGAGQRDIDVTRILAGD
jgi:hypothetical protein